MIMREENEVNPGQIMQIYSRVGSTSTRHTGAKVDMISRMEEVGLWVKHKHTSRNKRERGEEYICQDPNALPFPLHINQHFRIYV